VGTSSNNTNNIVYQGRKEMRKKLREGERKGGREGEIEGGRKE